jgi:enoyl-CoA hydratase/carnithine racemase
VTGGLEISATEYRTLIAGPYPDEALAGIAVLFVHPDGTEEVPGSEPGSVPTIVCWAGEETGTDAAPSWADVALGVDDRTALAEIVGRVPQAAVSLAVLLRQSTLLPIPAGLAAESAVYSMLQGGPEFAGWRSITPPAPDPQPDRPTVLVDRDGARLHVTLDRPHRHNAVTTRLRDELYGALMIAIVDESIDAVLFDGNGPSFCSGGDLGEFGRRPDPVTAHLTRLLRSPAALLERLRERLGDRLEVRVHGSTYGGGIEMAAFGGRVIADPATRIALPEVSLGLVPGAGGTASITRRIGRQRTAALGLLGAPIDAPTAHRWGLVDEIAEVAFSGR